MCLAPGLFAQRPGPSRVDEDDASRGLSRSSTIIRAMAKKIDPDQLVDPSGVAAIIGAASANVVSVYRKRYDDFPAPAIEKGRCLLWERAAIERWARASGRLQ